MEVLTEVDEDRLRRLAGAGESFWLDLLSPAPDDLERLSAALGLHPAAIEDTHEWGQQPRLDDYEDHLLLVFYSARSIDDRVEPVEVHVYIADGWVVTARRCETGLEGRRDWIAKAEHPLYEILDALADGWDPVIDEVDRRVDEVEEAVLERPQQEQLKTIYRLKQEVNECLRRAAPAHAGFPGAIDRINDIQGGASRWLGDVDAHLAGVTSDLRRLSGDLSALTDTFFNANANRLNRLATFVAIGSMFFLIWTLVTGFFGQNFGYLTEHIDSKGAFFAYEIGALLIPTVILAAVLYVKRKDWW